MSRDIITSKAAIRDLLNEIKPLSAEPEVDGLVAAVHQQLLRSKIRFPLLEYAARELYAELPENQRETVTDRIIDLDEIGSYVIAGMFLQQEIPVALNPAVDKAVRYILQGNKWYVCDIIGERVQGHALLTRPEAMLPVLHQLAQHPQPWIVRSVGVAGHYAIKKKLGREHTEKMFRLLLSLSSSADFHIKKGIGWAAKTAVKFHPFLAEKYREQIEDPKTGPWFRTKIRIGLGRSFQYAQ